MTFSQEVKNELCRAAIPCNQCKKAMLYGILMCCRGVRTDIITLVIENRALVDLFTGLLEELTGVTCRVISPDLNSTGLHPSYTIQIEKEEDIDKVIAYFFVDIPKRHYIPSFLTENHCCAVAFFRGVFLICGSIVNPAKEYHFELNISSERTASGLIELLEKEGFPFKRVIRGNSYVLYLKESNYIEDVLTYMGAVQSTFVLINMKIEKEMRNKANRVTNCETANIDKTVNASVLQLEKIKYIKEDDSFDTLPAELQEVALLRLMNPDASLRELCQLSGNTITRSGMNHRLKKLIDIADRLKQDE